MQDLLLYYRYSSNTLDLWFGDPDTVSGVGWDVPDPVRNALPPSRGNVTAYRVLLSPEAVLWTALPNVERFSLNNLKKIHCEVARIITVNTIVPIKLGEGMTLVLTRVKALPVEIVPIEAS